jgi:hypothetical protein
MRKPVRKTARKTVQKTTAAPRSPKPAPASTREVSGLLAKGQTRRRAAMTESTLDERSHRTERFSRVRSRTYSQPSAGAMLVRPRHSVGLRLDSGYFPDDAAWGPRGMGGG